MKRSPRSSAIALALVLCAALACVRAADPFIDAFDRPAPPPAPAPTRTAGPPTPPTPAPPAAAPAPQTPPAPAPPTPTPAPAAATPGTPKPGEPAVPQTKSAAVRVPITTAPAKPVVRSPSVNITAVPTAAPPPVKRGEAVETKKSGAAALFDVKVKGTHVAISPSGDVMIRNPDVDINTMRVVQMITGIVEAVKRVVESAKPAHRKESDTDARKGDGRGEEADEKEDAEEENEKGKGGDADGADGADARMQPIPSELTGGESTISQRPFSRDALVDDAKPYARKLHYRVRRSYTPGAGSVGDVRFDGFAPITMQLQQISTIPRSEFAPDAYRFAVVVPGSPTFYLDLPLKTA